MNELTVFLIGVFVLLLGVPIGNLLARWTKEELEDGRKWFEALIILSLLGGVFGLIIQNDGLMFACFFIALVTSRSLDFKDNKEKAKEKTKNKKIKGKKKSKKK
jgi:hypothetical protein